MGLFVNCLKMHDELFNQGNCRRGVGEGKGWSFDVFHNHISHEISSEANHGFEGYSDCERAGHGKIKQNLSFMSEYF